MATWRSYGTTVPKARPSTTTAPALYPPWAATSPQHEMPPWEGVSQQQRRRLRCIRNIIVGESGHGGSIMRAAAAAARATNTDGGINSGNDTREPVVDLAFWEREGYAVIERAASPLHCARMVSELWQMAGKCSEDPATWYQRMPV
eukprot:SAG25_NODE_155_length_13526_cov_48.309675_18_plen_145_part_01